MLDSFIVFFACLGFAWFNLKWKPFFMPKQLNWIPVVLQYAGVAGAGWILWGMLGL